MIESADVLTYNGDGKLVAFDTPTRPCPTGCSQSKAKIAVGTHHPSRPPRRRWTESKLTLWSPRGARMPATTQDWLRRDSERGAGLLAADRGSVRATEQPH